MSRCLKKIFFNRKHEELHGFKNNWTHAIYLTTFENISS